MNSTESYYDHRTGSLLEPAAVRPVPYPAAAHATQGHDDLLDAHLLDVLSADLREPLAIIKGAAETLLLRGERLTRDERHEFLTAIVDASERFDSILRRDLPLEL